jgi:hypothetical protein
MTDKTTAELLNDATELLEVANYLDDPQVTEALELIVKLMASPDVPPQKAAPLIVKVESFAAKFKIMAAYNTHINKTDRARKNLLYSLSESMERVAGGLKYLLR